uniref:class I mannose-6-phosphate isomerase n=1 Tax=Olsenella uli TaxID=133926 RepID=UPI0028EB9457|nr:class I mannose-6-phosphate isomerase [Olsenella uli]
MAVPSSTARASTSRPIAAWRPPSKAEAWYVLGADPGSTLIAGSLTDDVDALRAAAADNTIGDKYGRRVPVTEGDFIVVPAGTLHAYGAGIFAVGISTLGFTTYRPCDWGRGRELHVEKGFDVLDVRPQPDPIHLGGFDATAPARTTRGTAVADLFVIDIMDVPDTWGEDCDGSYRVLACVAGECDVSSEEGAVHLDFTESCLVPASAGSYTVTGPCRLISSRMRH